MWDTRYMPYEPTHPGELLKDELQARNISQKSFAQLIGVSCSYLSGVVNEKRPVTSELAMLLEASLNIKAYIWVRMQTEYDLCKAQKSNKLSVRLAEIRKVCAMF